jgi:hypothetical protein
MMRSRLILAGSALLATAAFATTQAAADGPTAVAAKVQKVTITGKSNDPSSFTNISSKLDGTFGKGTQGKCCLQIPKSSYTWTFKGGTIIATGVSKISGSSVTGTWKVTPGKSTGRFKGLTGGGTFTGDLPSGKYVFKGTVRQ